VKKLILLFFLLCIFVSCSFDEYGFEFDEKSFNIAKEKWESLGLENYSFDIYGETCKFTDYFHGNVIVNDNIGKISFDKYTLKEWNIKTFDDLFSEIYKSYQNAKKGYSAGKYDLVSYKIDYDETYFYPKSAEIRVHKGSDKEVQGVLFYFYIADFKILKN